MRSSSASRQSTGSSRPSCARRVRSRPYFSLGRPLRAVAHPGLCGQHHAGRKAGGTPARPGAPRCLAAASHRLAVQDGVLQHGAEQVLVLGPGGAGCMAHPKRQTRWPCGCSEARSRSCAGGGAGRCRCAWAAASLSGRQMVTRLRRRKSAAGPWAVCSMASSRCPVSAVAQPCCPARRQRRAHRARGPAGQPFIRTNIAFCAASSKFFLLNQYRRPSA